MSGWPSLDSSDDRRLAESLASGDEEALPQIFDGHAARLFDYCHALLRDQESASAALYSAVLAACAHVGRLRSPERFRAWLYALVRNECLRRLAQAAEPGMVHDPWTGEPRPRREAPEVEDLFVDAEERTRRLELRQLVHNALASLTGRERETLDLLLRHALSTAEIAGVLGMGEHEAANLAVQAQANLEEALAAVLIARTGREDCPSVAALVAPGEWPLSPATTQRVVRHIESCPACAERRNRRMSPGRLLQVLPVALMPADLRTQVLEGAQHPDPMIAERAEPFDEQGWPLPVQQAAERPEKGTETPRLWPAIAAAAVVLLVVGGAFWALPSSSGSPSSAGTPTAAVSDPVAEPADESPSESPSEPSDSPSTPSPSAPTTPATSPSAAPSTRAPQEPRVPSTRPTSRRPSPVPGSLSAAGCSIAADEQSCSITLTAVGGTVRWSVTASSGGVSAGGGGTLRSGQSTGVTASRPAECTGAGGSGSVSFSPSASASVTWTCPEGEATTGPVD